jgi:hypothetical protein
MAIVVAPELREHRAVRTCRLSVNQIGQQQDRQVWPTDDVAVPTYAPLVDRITALLLLAVGLGRLRS